ncbi:MAG: glutamate racemase [Syntrophomonas sp.]|nr:glutamate racemase [Syntrophomonas sp.]
MKTKPIGIFDSGVGGLSVVKILLDRLPFESFVFYGDTAHVPYGTKSRDELCTYSKDIISFLLSREVKTIVVACNTSSSITLPEIEKTCPIPILGVAKPGAREAARVTRNGKIGVIATQATVNSGSFSANIKAIDSDYEIFSVACPRLVPMVESGVFGGLETRQAVEEYTAPILRQGIDTLVMGCTHYPFLAPVISDIAGNRVTLVDPAAETIEELIEILGQNNILNDNHAAGTREFYVSGNEDSFYKVGRLLIGDVIQKVEQIKLD